MILADNAERGGIQADGGLEGDLLDARGDAAGSDGFLSKVLHEPCDDEDGERVLISRPYGLEDSSRYWSVWMTLDHLPVVHHSLVRVIRALTNGSVPRGRASTADVKPSPDVTHAVLAEYEQSCDELLATVAEAPNLNNRVRYAHPWFGPLNAAGWHALSGGHLSIHRVQIERILAGVSASPLLAEK